MEVREPTASFERSLIAPLAQTTPTLLRARPTATTTPIASAPLVSSWSTGWQWRERSGCGQCTSSTAPFGGWSRTQRTPLFVLNVLFTAWRQYTGCRPSPIGKRDEYQPCQFICGFMG